MSDLIKQWLIYKELLGLAKLESFNNVRPERVAKVLAYYADSRSNNMTSDGNVSLHTPRLLRSESAMSALMSIWELASQASQQDEIHRFKWHAVMANCNSVYDGSVSRRSKKTTSDVKFSKKFMAELLSAPAQLCQNS